MASRWHPLLLAEAERTQGTDRAAMERLSSLLWAHDATTNEFEAFFRLSPDFLLVLDHHLEVLHLNARFEAWGYASDSFVGRPFVELVAPDERDTALNTLRSALATREWVPLATRCLTAAGARRMVHWQLSVNDDGTRMFLVGRDVTEQEKLKQDLTQAQQHEAVARLASTVAHETNTPLQFINDNLGFLEDSMRDLKPVFDTLGARPLDPAALQAAVQQADVEYLKGELPRALESMREGVRRVRQLVASLKELAPQPNEVSRRVQVDLVPVLRALVEDELHEHREVKFDAALEPLPMLDLDVSAVTRVVGSLLDNAVRAVRARHGAGGRVTVRSSVEGSCAQVSVTDDGTGISEAVSARLFEAFFTTRDVGEGMGQSLAIARSVMERHGGTIDFQSVEGHGATFTLRFPLPVDESLWN